MSENFVCCNNVQLSAQERDGLLCEFDGTSVAAKYEASTISCKLPHIQETGDIERQGLRLRVSTQSGRTLRDEVLPPMQTGSVSTSQQPSLHTAKDGVDKQADPDWVAGYGLESADATLGEAGAPGSVDEAAAKEANREQPLPEESRMRRRYSALKPFIIISVSYLLFTITDGAVRMIVLLHAYQQGFSAMQVAAMFSMYELAGVVTNLLAGLMGARWGIKTTLLTGLSVQLVGLGMLFAWQNSWSKVEAIIYVTAAQMLCGVAKDLTKLGGKTITKLVTPEEKQSSLFKLVSLITGWKNSLKGAGYFLGAATVGVSYYLSLGILCGLILAAYPWAVLGLSNQLGRARKENVKLGSLFKSKHNVNILSLSRVFLFGSRDLWFEVPLPFFLRSPASGIGWSRALTGAFLAIFIIVYGQMQSWTPQLVLQPLRQSPPTRLVASGWAALLAVPTSILGGVMLGTDVFGEGAPQGGAIAALTTTLYAFCLLFAVNSAVHSYLIVRYSEGDKVAMNVGVYYCANAVGRLVGTLASGALYSYVGSTVVDGFGACLFVSVGFAVLSAAIDLVLHEDPERESAWVPRWLRAKRDMHGAAAAAAGELSHGQLELNRAGGSALETTVDDAGSEKGSEPKRLDDPDGKLGDSKEGGEGSLAGRAPVPAAGVPSQALG